MDILVGTSGYSYKEWKGPFYPADLAAADMLAFYATRLRTVEINNTFYRMPTTKLLSGWAEKVPEGFSFVLKASRRITHSKRLKECGDELDYLLQTAGTLGVRLGPLLFQLPPNMKKDIERLRAFAALVPRERAVAMEFRNPSWFDDEVYDTLREHGLALVTSDTDKQDNDAPVIGTARFGYLRLRRAVYSPAELATWAERVRAQNWERAFVFFKHEDEGAGPRMAEAFERAVSAL
ncbi:MAG: DUF72 domain-containing protein [bacterium]|nr:DUF72 domain-containing protein [bacterium]